MAETIFPDSRPAAITHDRGRPSAAEKLRYIKSLKCTWKLEQQAWAKGAAIVAGVDEVGRGCLFGPVVAAAVILNPSYRMRGLRDSKLLPRSAREKLAQKIRSSAIAIAIASVEVEIIDKINIYQASRLAMLNAVRQLDPAPDHLLVDAMAVDCSRPQTKVIHGDALSVSIAAASIVAKVERDRMMEAMALLYPQYDLASNKGYGTARHLAALREFGPTPHHRKSFAPVSETQGTIVFAADGGVAKIELDAIMEEELQDQISVTDSDS